MSADKEYHFGDDAVHEETMKDARLKDRAKYKDRASDHPEGSIGFSTALFHTFLPLIKQNFHLA